MKNVLIRVNKREYKEPNLHLDVDAVSMDGQQALPNTTVVLNFLKQRQKFPTNEHGTASIRTEFQCARQGVRDKLLVWLEDLNNQKISPVVEYDLISPAVEKGIRQSQEEQEQANRALQGELDYTRRSLRDKTTEAKRLRREKAEVVNQKNEQTAQLGGHIAGILEEKKQSEDYLQATIARYKNELELVQERVKEFIGPEEPDYELMAKREEAKRNLEVCKKYWANTDAYYKEVQSSEKSLALELQEARRKAPIIGKEHKRINEELEVINEQKRARIKELKQDFLNVKLPQGITSGYKVDDKRIDGKVQNLLKRWRDIFPLDDSLIRTHTQTLYHCIESFGGGVFSRQTHKYIACITDDNVRNDGKNLFIIKEGRRQDKGEGEILCQETEYRIAAEAITAYEEYVANLEKKHTEAEAELERMEEERQKAYEGLQEAKTAARAVNISPEEGNLFANPLGL